jgi:uncharacterized protein HemX
MADNKAKEINFLAAEEREKIKLREALAVSSKRAGLVLAVWLLALAVIFGYGFYLQSQNDSLKSEAKSLDNQLLVLEDKITLILIFKDRLGKIDQIFDQRDDLGQSLENFFATVPGGINLTQVNLDEKSLAVDGTGDILAISQLAANYIDQSQDWYSGAVLKSLVKNEKDTDFTFSLLIQL